VKENKLQSKIGNWQAILVLVVMLGLLVSGCGAEKPKVYRVGIIKGGTFVVIADGFQAGMAELGYVEGENIVYDARDPGADLSGAQAAAEQLVADKVDLIFTSGSTPSALAAKAATQGTDIPVVFAYAATEGTNLVESVRQPGGNITGVRYTGAEQLGRRLEILLEIAPEVERVWIGYDINNPNTASSLGGLRPVAASLGVTLVEVPATTPEELKADLAARAASDDLGMDAMLTMPDGFNSSPDGVAMLSQFATEHKVPLAGSTIYTVEQGAVFGNANDLFEVGELAAPSADKVLQGTPAGEIPVVTPNEDLYINYKLAQELGLTVPEGLLSQATEIIR
jgi:putative ABC transport system substrate-binding protein